MAPMSSSRQFVLWCFGALAATLVLIGILVFEYRAPARRHVLYVVGVPEKGAELFFGQKHCSGCHAINGRGGSIGPDLATIHPARPAMAWLATALWNHAPAMWRRVPNEAPPQLDQEEMAHILAFLYRASASDIQGDPRVGSLVFSLKGCIRCHSVRGQGGNSAPELSKVAAGDSVAWVGAMWTHAQHMIGPITREIGAWPEFQGEEMSHLIAFVSDGQSPALDAFAGETALRGDAQHGWRVFQDKCFACHSVAGKGGHVGPELGPDRELPHSTSRFAAILWNHAPAMVTRVQQHSVAMPTLEGGEIKDVLTFLISLEYFEPSGSPLLGERVFSERGCARCHGPKGEGTSQGPRLRPTPNAYTLVSLASTLWNHGPGMAARAQQLGAPWPTLEGTDLGDLTGFLNDSGNAK
jgi:mono/diheme cytochrome c family protein